RATGGDRPAAGPGVADGAAAGAHGHACGARRRRPPAGGGAAGTAARRRRLQHPRPADREPRAVIIREDLADVEPYRWQEGWEQRIPPGTPVIRLDQNTQPRPRAWYAGSAAWLAGVTVNRYPDSSYLRLREAISGYTGFPADQIVATAGAVARRHGLRAAALLRPLRGCHRPGRRRARRSAGGRAPDLGLLAPQPHRP